MKTVGDLSAKSKFILITVSFILFSSVLFPLDILSIRFHTPQEENQSVGVTEITNTIIPYMAESDNFTENLPFNVTYSDGYFDGYNLFSIASFNRTDGSNEESCLVITDMNGSIIATKSNVFPLTPVKFINSTTVIYTETSPIFQVCLWNIQTNTTQPLGFSGHHETEYNSRDNTIFTFKGYNKDINGTIYYYDRIYEYDLTGSIVWSLDTSLFIPPEWWCPYSDYQTNGRIDITHSNSMFYDPIEDVIYYNARNPNTFFKINHTSSEVIWGLGEHGNFTLFDARGNVKESVFYHAHAVEQVDDNTFILFDNDYHNQTLETNYRSRILEITINETTMTANESWSWTGSSAYYCAYWGDADRLPNGNRFGTFGARTHKGALYMGARLVEVNSVGEIVWEMNFPSSVEFNYGIYQAERFRFSPILDSPSDMIVQENTATEVTWNTQYNFRPRLAVEGNFSLLLDGVEIENGSVFYDRLWRPVNLTLYLGILDLGTYNCTLIVYDEIGNNTVDTIIIQVLPFYIDNEGPTIIEIGQTNHVLTWYGTTMNPHMCNISVDETIVQNLEWDGANITLDLEVIGVGLHIIEIVLYNSTHELYTDSLWITVYPTEVPIITPIQTSPLFIVWNDSQVLSWDLFDNTPQRWEIYLNNSKYTESEWNLKSYYLEWLVPILDESLYNVTIVAIDGVDQRTSDTIWLHVTPPSPPIIATIPLNTAIEWGTTGISFTWSAHGGNTWKLWKNGTIADEGLLIGNIVEKSILNWQDENWRPGTYNLTLQVLDDSSSTSRAVFISVYIDLGDPYADAILPERSDWYLFGENAIGAPDDNFAVVFLDYGNGYLTLDMGLHEEITDGEGDDFYVVAQGGNYSIYVGAAIDILFIPLGYSSGNHSFDLAGSGLDSVRYVRIEYRTGVDVEIDAIVALNFNVPDGDSELPLISSISDFWAWDNQTSIPLSWSVSDATPWSYEILVNNSQVASGSWNGSAIEFVFEPSSSGWWNITLVLFDVFDNQAYDTVVIEIRSQPSTSTPVTTIPESPLILISIIVSGVVGSILIVLLTIRCVRKDE